MAVEIKIHNSRHRVSIRVNTSNVITNKCKGGLKMEEKTWKSGIRLDTNRRSIAQADIENIIALISLKNDVKI